MTSQYDGNFKSEGLEAVIYKAFPWRSKTIFGRALYLLAHCRRHMVEINPELRRRELPRIK